MVSDLIHSVCDILVSVFGFLPIPGAGGSVGMACYDLSGVVRSMGL